jgi:TolB protein
MHRAARSTSDARIPMRAALGLLGALASGCADRGPTGPNEAYVRVVIAATGGDVDQDGYDITIDALLKATLGNRAVERTFIVPIGTHVVAIDRVAENCRVDGLNPRPITVGRGETATVQFDVGCATTGVMITTHTDGGDIPQSFSVFVDALPAVLVGPNKSVPVSRLTSGKHTVFVQAPQHCTVSPSPLATVTVTVPGLTETSFDIRCSAIQRLAKIAYVNGWSQDNQWIELVNPDGSGVAQLPLGHSPAWSPDGKRLAFSNFHCVPSPYFAYAPVCTGGLVMLDPELGDATEPIWGPGVENPSWSPTGDAIAVDKDGRTATDRDIAVAQLATPLLQRLPIALSGWKAQPTWSPDGTQIAFTCMVAQSGIDICTVNRDGGGLVQLTNDPSFDGHAAWSPDGTKIAFARYPDAVSSNADAEIVVMDLATRQVTILTNGGEPAWSPDGSKLVFASDDGLFIIDADGTNRRRLTTGPHHAPAWRP